MSKFCKFCGKELIENEACTCSKSKTEYKDTKNENSNFIAYLIEFSKGFFTVENIPLIIYLILNMVIAYFIIAISYYFVGHVNPEYSDLYHLLNVIVIVIVSILAVVISISDVGESVIRYINGCKKIVDDETLSRVEPLFVEVYQRAKQVYPQLSSNISIYVQESEKENAFAIGRNTICVTRGLLALSDEEIKGAIAHEFGHIAFKHNDMNALVFVFNAILNLAFIEVTLIASVFILVIEVASKIILGKGTKVIGRLMQGMFSITGLFGMRTFQKLLFKLFANIIFKSKKEHEYAADEFAVNAGYSEGLTKFISAYGDIVSKDKKKDLKKMSGYAVISSEHPPSRERIQNIKKINKGAAVKDISETVDTFVDITADI